MKRPILFIPALVLSATAAFACGGSSQDDSDAKPDGPVSMLDAGTGAGRPSWMLEDIQPASPRIGQTYGLDTFGNKTVVVVLLEGF